MRVENQSAAQGSSTSNSGVMSGAEGDMFMKLLLAQLKSQDPLAPTDANQFVSQLVQFNTLSEITQIRDLVASLGTPPATTK